jgi:hypothetical protein
MIYVNSKTNKPGSGASVLDSIGTPLLSRPQPARAVARCSIVTDVYSGTCSCNNFKFISVCAPGIWKEWLQEEQDEHGLGKWDEGKWEIVHTIIRNKELRRIPGQRQ